MTETVESDGQVLALIVRSSPDRGGVAFYTPPENSLQLGILEHRQGTEIKPHIHKEVSRLVRDVQEVLHIEHGVVLVDFYADDGTRLGSRKLSDGDTILLMNGGHGLSVLSDARIIEVKQGPYYGSNEDKTWLNPK